MATYNLINNKTQTIDVTSFLAGKTGATLTTLLSTLSTFESAVESARSTRATLTTDKDTFNIPSGKTDAKVDFLYDSIHFATNTSLQTYITSKALLDGSIAAALAASITLTSEKAALAAEKATLTATLAAVDNTTHASESAAFTAGSASRNAEVSTLTSEKAALAAEKATLTSEKAALAAEKATLILEVDGLHVSTYAADKTAFDTAKTAADVAATAALNAQTAADAAQALVIDTATASTFQTAANAALFSANADLAAATVAATAAAKLNTDAAKTLTTTDNTEALAASATTATLVANANTAVTTAAADVASAAALLNPSTRVAALVTNLDASAAILATFLAAADGVDNITSATHTSLALAKADALAAKNGTNGTVAVLDTFIEGAYAASSPTVRALLLSEQQALNAATINTANNGLITALTNLNQKSGLVAAVNDLSIKTSAANDAVLLVASTQTQLNLAVAAYNVLNNTTITVSTLGEVTGLIVVNNQTGTLQFDPALTDIQKTAITAVLNASIAKETADVILAAANTARGAADLVVDLLDTATVNTVHGTLDAKFALTTKAGLVSTLAEINAESAALTTATALLDLQIANVGTANAAGLTLILNTAVTNHVITGGTVSQSATIALAYTTAETALVGTGAAAAQAALLTASNKALFDTAFDAYVVSENGDSVGENPLTEVLTGKSIALKAAQDFAAALAAKVTLDANADLAISTASSNLDIEIGLALRESDANHAFEGFGFALPNKVDEPFEIGTTLKDVFVAGTLSSSIFNFTSNDFLSIGTGFTLNTGAVNTGVITAVDNNAVLEVFLVQNGLNTNVVLETAAYSSDSTGVPETTITLIGVNAANVHLTNGLITVS